MTDFSEFALYPYGLRYISKKDDEGIEEYNKKTNESIHSKLRRHSGRMYFTMKDLTFRNNFISSHSSDEKNSHKIGLRELCLVEEAKFGTVLDEHNLSSLSFLGTDRKIEDIPITIRPTDNDDDVEFCSFSFSAFIDDMFSDDESFAIEIIIQTSFFSTIKELAFSGKLESLTLAIDGSEIDGLYSSGTYFETHHDNVRILAELDMVENKEDMPDIYTVHGLQDYESKTSKNFTLSYSTKNFPFESHEPNEIGEEDEDYDDDTFQPTVKDELLSENNRINSSINTKLMWVVIFLAWIVFALVFQIEPFWK